MMTLWSVSEGNFVPLILKGNQAKPVSHKLLLLSWRNGRRRLRLLDFDCLEEGTLRASVLLFESRVWCPRRPEGETVSYPGVYSVPEMSWVSSSCSLRNMATLGIVSLQARGSSHHSIIADSHRRTLMRKPRRKEDEFATRGWQYQAYSQRLQEEESLANQRQTNEEIAREILDSMGVFFLSIGLLGNPAWQACFSSLTASKHMKGGRKSRILTWLNYQEDDDDDVSFSFSLLFFSLSSSSTVLVSHKSFCLSIHKTLSLRSSWGIQFSHVALILPEDSFKTSKEEEEVTLQFVSEKNSSLLRLPFPETTTRFPKNNHMLI